MKQRLLPCECGEVRSKKIMDPRTIRTKVQGDNFKKRAPGRRIHEIGQTLGDERPADTIEEKPIARVPFKR